MATTIGAVWTRLNSLVADDPFRFIPAEEPFSFDLQPSQQIDQVYRIETRPVAMQGYLGPAQLEQWAVDLWWARKTQADAPRVYGQMLIDADALINALVAEGRTQEYDVLDQLLTGRVSVPDGGDYLVGVVSVVVDFDRAL